MKFLLAAVNAKFIHSNPAVYSLASYAGKVPGREVIVKEYTINEPVSGILAKIYREKPDYLAVSCYIWNTVTVRRLCAELPKVLPETRIFLGGPEVSFHCEEVLEKFSAVTAVMTGEGEETFRELFRRVPEKPEDLTEDLLKTIPGLWLGSGPSLERKPLPMDEVPFFYTEETLGLFSNRILYYESQRGCPYRCSYCLSSIDKTLRKRSMGRVKEHLDFFLRNRVRQVKFIDRTFNASPEHALEIWEYLLEHDNGVTNFHFEIASDLLTEEEIRVIGKMRPGLIQLEIGVQSVNEETLCAIRRKTEIRKIRETVSRLLEPGNVHLHLDLIAGLPCEDLASFRKSFNEVFSMGPHELQLGFLKVLSGTEMEERAAEYGILYQEEAPYEVLSTNWITYGELLELKRTEEMLETYYNSCQYRNTVPLLLEKFPTPYGFFESLGAWYEKMGYTVYVPSRAGKYEVLLEYAASLGDAVFTEKVRDALTLDYYLREKPKSRPAFCRTVPDLEKIDYSRKDPVTGNAVMTGGSIYRITGTGYNCTGETCL